jgi:hypothetical protein
MSIKAKKEDVEEFELVLPDQAYAKAFDRLSTEEKISITSNIWAKQDIPRFQLALNMGRKNGLDFDWLVDFAHDGLALRCSYKARARDDLTKAIVADVERKQGVGQKLKDFLSGEKGK